MSWKEYLIWMALIIVIFVGSMTVIWSAILPAEIKQAVKGQVISVLDFSSSPADQWQQEELSEFSAPSVPSGGDEF